MSPVADIDFAAYLSQIPFPSLQLPAIRTYFGCLSSAIKYLHGRRIRHSDIKPAKILINSGDFLTDFGLSRYSIDIMLPRPLRSKSSGI
jgi:serine/threonine protein kinase